MIISAAQTVPERENFEKNLRDHLRLNVLAADNGAQLIVFPELSLTGYEREKAKNFYFTENDSRLDELRKMVQDKKIIIMAGAPIKMNLGLYIGSFILFPDNAVKIYTKQFLHTGEEEFFVSSSNYNPIIKLDDATISMAVCFDIENSQHVLNASNVNSTVYVPSIFYTPSGIAGAHNLLSGYAEKYSMNILMSNYGGKTWGLDSGVRSAFWNDKGKLITEIDCTGEGLIIVEKCNGNWTGNTIKTK